MLQVVRNIFLLVTMAVACGCNRFELKGLIMPTGKGVDVRFEESKDMNSDLNAGCIEAQESYIFYAATDPHIEKTSRNLSIFNAALRNDDEASFGVILGDCIEIRDNLHNYLKALAFDPAMHSCDHRIFHIIGNHDIYFNGWEDFRQDIGPSVYWFEVIFPQGKDLYISLDTATGTLGRKQTRWLKTFLEDRRKEYRHCVILTHTNFLYTDTSQAATGNMPIEESIMLIDFLGRQQVSLVLQGHDHYRDDQIYDNVRYTVLGAINDEATSPEYLKITVGKDDFCLDWQVIAPGDFW